MERVDCLICNGETDGAEANIAPFLARYCGITDTTTEIRYCRACDFAFFKRRLTDQEASKLYSDYRGAEYNRIRLEVEPSYAHYIRQFDDDLSEDYVTRIRDHNDLLDVYPELDEFQDILDFGGNGTIPGRVFPHAKIWIDDLSAGSTDDGRKHGLIFASNVFEHVSDPVPLLKSLTQRLDPEGIMFIDVPGPLQASLSEGLLWQRKHGGDMYLMHEHINYFARRSLNRLVRAAGLVPVFEFRARHTAQGILAVFNGSEIASKLLPQREPRRLLYEAKLARSLASDASEWTWRATNAAASRAIDALSERIGSAIEATESAKKSISERIGSAIDTTELEQKLSLSTERERALRCELESVYRSSSWQITAPMRAIKNLIVKIL
ncbi:methyltransferase domain-containing protein [Burkholderia ubonensis]|uniref:methyltransferase domain-containing protein n=1 Tax=Burkholderia ubonensis TaxID=101571 RepID=UPI0009B3235A|nr:methyltransferase domain-containing protein [Burkholderia ubonensis]